ncbi:hypothetical protein [Capybara microvirus Cap1_SP_137]|nr:hypothetical protein [Capybara microvirus Cap1_SP_137]
MTETISKIDELRQQAYETGDNVLRWHDEQEKDFLIVQEKNDYYKRTAAAAKGVTIYEMIQIYGSVDAAAAATGEVPASAMIDASDVPQFGGNVDLDALANLLLAKAQAAQQANNAAKTAQNTTTDKTEDNPQ